MFPKAAEAVWRGVSATELHFKLVIPAVKKCQKVFFLKGHFLTPRSLLEEPLGLQEDLGSTSFTRPQEQADLSTDTPRMPSFIGCPDGRHSVITALSEGDCDPGNLHTAITSKCIVLATGNVQNLCSVFSNSTRLKRLADGEQSGGQLVPHLCLAEVTGIAQSKDVHSPPPACDLTTYAFL